MAESKGIKTQITLIDNMSAVVTRINSNLNSMMTTMYNASEAVENGFDENTVNQFRQAVEDSQAATKELETQLNGINADSFGGLTQGSIVFGNVIGNIITSAGRMAVNAIQNTITSSVEAYNVQRNAEQQLMSVLQNTSDNAVESFDKIIAKSKEIQKNGIYGDEAMVAAGAEFATYFSDTGAIESMMDTLSDYAMGMSGGGALDSKAMVDYATNIAKLTTGAYDAMTKKGFEVTDTQKAILKGTATQSQLAEELGEDYASMSEDMQKATVINQIIAESWDGLYESMSNTPEGQIISLTNAWVDLKEVMGGQILIGMQAINNVLEENWQTIQTVMTAFSQALNLILHAVSKIIEVAIQVAQVIVDNWSWIAPIIFGIAAAVLAYNAAVLVATVAQWAMNGALFACPIVWIIAAIGILIGLIILIIQKIAEVTGAAGSAFGMITGGLNVLKTGVTNFIADVVALFWGLVATVTEVASAIAEKLNFLPFVNIDTEGLTNAAEEFRAKQQAAIDSKVDYKVAFENGAAWGDNVVSDITTGLNNIINPEQMDMLTQNTSGIAASSAATADALSTDDTDMAYLKDIAEQETINRFTTAEIKVDMGGVSQNISKETDADSVIDYLVKGIGQGMSEAAEGVYA